MTPGARDVFTQGFASRPASTAFRASRPAASITLGFEVFVQLVIAAITTLPWPSAVALAGAFRKPSSPGSTSMRGEPPSATNRPISVPFGSGSR